MKGTINMDDIAKVKDEDLMRLLEFAMDRDPSGPRMRETPPTSRSGIIEILVWLGVIDYRPKSWSGYY